MKIAICSTFIPFVFGGGRNIVDWLKQMLVQNGHQVEVVYLPQLETIDKLCYQMMAFRWIDLSAADRVICFRTQAHLISHPHKILWFIHHLRLFYDLWDSPYRHFPDNEKTRALRDTIKALDTKAFNEAKQIFTNSKVVSNRLLKFNNIESEVLYPPVYQSERFHCQDHNDEIVYICRVEHHKRQHLLIEAMQFTKTAVRLRICGLSSDLNYLDQLRELINHLHLTHKVTLDIRWISEEEKVAYLSTCLAAAYLPVDEDSYGYPSLEASHAAKALLTTNDSGGVLELVQDGYNGYITAPNAEALAHAMDDLFHDREATILMGKNALNRLKDLNISWSHVIERLLA